MQNVYNVWIAYKVSNEFEIFDMYVMYVMHVIYEMSLMYAMYVMYIMQESNRMKVKYNFFKCM